MENQTPLNKNGSSERHYDLKNMFSGLIIQIKKQFSNNARLTGLITLIISLAMLVIGALNVGRCPIRKQIPLFLIVIGSLGVISALINTIRDRILSFLDVKYLKCFESLLYAIYLIFLILGSYWTFSVFKPSYDPSTGDSYCKKTVYMSAFIYITFLWTCFITIILGFLFFLVCVLFVIKTADKPQERDVEEATEETS